MESAVALQAGSVSLIVRPAHRKLSGSTSYLRRPQYRRRTVSARRSRERKSLQVPIHVRHPLGRSVNVPSERWFVTIDTITPMTPKAPNPRRPTAEDFEDVKASSRPELADCATRGKEKVRATGSRVRDRVPLRDRNHSIQPREPRSSPSRRAVTNSGRSTSAVLRVVTYTRANDRHNLRSGTSFRGKDWAIHSSRKLSGRSRAREPAARLRTYKRFAERESHPGRTSTRG